VPVDCPIATYNPMTGRASIEACITCPAGSFCNDVGISRLDRWPCPAGQFCLNGTLSPLNCPGGTYRDKVSAKSEADCAYCPGGHYCPVGSKVHFSFLFSLVYTKYILALNRSIKKNEE
jgi:hypothetical protein